MEPHLSMEYRSITKLSKTHLSHLDYRAARPGEPWNPREESLKAFEQGGRPASVLGRREALSGAPHARALVGATGAPSTPERHGSNCRPSCGILTGKNRLGADNAALIE